MPRSSRQELADVVFVIPTDEELMIAGTRHRPQVELRNDNEKARTRAMGDGQLAAKP